MTDKRKIEIKLSKRKLALMFIGSIVFVVIGILFILNPSNFKSIFLQNSTVVFISGLSSVLFFGIVGIFIFKKLGDKKIGLTITNEEIIDNSSGVSAGQILWSDVAEIKVVQVFNQKFLMLIVDNPEEYINRQTNLLKQKAMQINYKSYGSPISITANGLQTNFQELKNILENKFQEFKLKSRSV